MPIIGMTTFRGLVPKINPRRLGAEEAQTAENCELYSRILTPFYRPIAVETLSDSSQKSIYLWRYNSVEELWLSWDSDVNVVKGPLREDDKDRIYYSDGVGDIRIKGYDDGIQDRVASLPAPSKIKVEKEWLFDPEPITGTNGGLRMTLTGWERNEDRLKLIFHTPSYKSEDMDGTGFRVSIPGAGNVPTTTHGPKRLIYDESLDLLDDDGEKYGEFQVISMEPTNYDWESALGSGYIAPYDIEITAKMNYKRSTTQYVYYVGTFVDDWGMEGPPSTLERPYEMIHYRPRTLYHDDDKVSDPIEWNPGEKLLLTLSGNTPGGYHLEKRRIYRSAAGTEEDDFFYLGEVDENVSTYTDVKSDAELGEPLPLFQNPPAGLQGLIVLPGGFTAAFKGKEIYFSGMYYPHSYPDQYRITFAWDIVAIASSGNDVIVMTEGNPYYVTGLSPEAMSSTELMVSQSCVSKRGVATVGGTVIYPSPDGFVGVTSGQAKLISEQFYDPKEFRDLVPSGCISAAHNKKLFAFFGSTALVWDFDQGTAGLVSTTEAATGLFVDLENDSLYLIQDAEITQWQGSTTYMTTKWKSKEFQAQKPMQFNSARVEADLYDNCILRLYSQSKADVDPQLRATINVIDSKAFRLPILRPEHIWVLEIENNAPVTEMLVSTSMDLIRKMGSS